MLRIIVIAVVIVIVAIGGFHKFQKYTEQQQALAVAGAERAEQQRQRILTKHQEVAADIARLQAKEEKSQHDLWLLGHHEKTLAHLSQYLPAAQQESLITPTLNLVLLENASMVVIMLTCFAAMFFLSQRNRRQFPAQPGLQPRPHRRTPYGDVADKTLWQPMKGGGANFQTHKLIAPSAHQLIIKNSGQLTFVFVLFIGVGVNATVFSLLRLLQKQGLDTVIAQPLETLSALTGPGMVFVLVGCLLSVFFGSSNIRFDRRENHFQHGGTRRALRDIHALQIISELAGGHGSGVFNSYELNLVLNDGQRIHLMDHGDYMAFTHDAETLAEFLAVPIWET